VTLNEPLGTRTVVDQSTGQGTAEDLVVTSGVVFQAA